MIVGEKLAYHSQGLFYFRANRYYYEIDGQPIFTLYNFTLTQQLSSR